MAKQGILVGKTFRIIRARFSTQPNYYSLAHKWHGKSFTNHFARKQFLRKPPDTTILDTLAMLKRFFKKRVMTTPVLFYACFWIPLFFCRKMLPDAQGPQIIPQVVFFVFTISTLRPSSQDLQRFTKILASIKDFLKKQASKLLSCRGGLGEAPYNIQRSSVRHPHSPCFVYMFNDLS